LWGFYATVTLGILGFTVGSDKVAHDRTRTRILQVGYGVFASANMIAVATSQWELLKMAETIRTKVLPPELAGLASAPIHPAYFAAFHVAIAVAVIHGIQQAHRWRSSLPLPPAKT
jgi:hypothetical protein